jgi:hypothetical protein
MKRGSSASSSSASRSFLIAVLMLCSKSTKVSEGHSFCRRSSRDYLPRLLDQDGQNLKGFFLELDLVTVVVQFTRNQVDFERAETDVSLLCGGYLHGQ